MNYLIAVLSDRIQAEAAYSALEEKGLPLEQIAILGRGYKSADEFGLIDPSAPARQQAQLMATWLVPFGFAGGVTFSIVTGLQTFAWAGEIGNHVVGGFCGAIGGAMGSLFAGGGVGLLVGGGDAVAYRNRLDEGKYLVAVRGTDRLLSQAQPILRQFAPEMLQGYTAPST